MFYGGARGAQAVPVIQNQLDLRRGIVRWVPRNCNPADVPTKFARCAYGAFATIDARGRFLLRAGAEQLEERHPERELTGGNGRHAVGMQALEQGLAGVEHWGVGLQGMWVCVWCTRVASMSNA